MMRVLLTGAAGFIGSLVAEALVARGDEVVGVDNFDPFYPRPDKERNLRALRRAAGFALHEVDILDTAALRALLTPGTVVLHLAAKAGVRPSLADPVGYARVNLTGTASVLEAARQAGVTRLVFASSSSVYGEATPSPFREDAPAVHQISPYAASKRAGELMLGAFAPHAGLRAAALRLFTVYGPRQRPDLAIHAFARRLHAGEPITVFGDGGQLRDFTYCDDIVAGIVAATDWTARAPVGMDIFNLGGGHPVTLSAVIDLLGRAMKCVPRVEYRPPMPGDVRVTAADIAKARAVLGYAPRTAFAEGIRLFTVWFNDAIVRQS